MRKYVPATFDEELTYPIAWRIVGAIAEEAGVS
jgi:hypothetical protein